MKGLIDLIANIGFKGSHKQARDTLGRVYAKSDALRSRISAASCLRSGGNLEQ
jgi:hypothetical protein